MNICIKQRKTCPLRVFLKMNFEGCFQRPKLAFSKQAPNVVCDEKRLITVLYLWWFWLGWIGVGQQLAKLGICIPIAMSNVKLISFVDLMSLQYQQFALLSTWWPWSSVIWRVGQKYSLPSDPIVPNDPICASLSSMKCRKKNLQNDARWRLLSCYAFAEMLPKFVATKFGNFANTASVRSV